jgi:type I restriction enzyme S subunit
VLWCRIRRAIKCPFRSLYAGAPPPETLAVLTAASPLRTVPLREVVDLVTGATPPRHPDLYDGAIPLFRPGDLDRPGPLHTARDTVTERGACHGRLLPPGAVLVSCIGLLGKVGLLAVPALSNQQLTALIPRPGLVPEYVYYWAQTLRPWLAASASATTLPIVNQRRLGSAPFPLVPLDEQLRIVAILTAAQARHQRAAAALSRVPGLLGQLRRCLLESGLAAAASGSADRGPPPPIVQLGSLAQVQVGYPFRSGWFASSGVRLLRGVNIAPGSLSWTHTAHLPESMAARYPTYALRAGDVVVGLDRPLIAGGMRVARLRPEDLPALLVQRVGRILPREGAADRLDGEYLLLSLQSEAAVRHLEARATGTQLPHISPTDLQTVPLPLPPLSRQREIVAQTRVAWQRVAAAAAQASAARSRLEALWQELLRRAFSGQLGDVELAELSPAIAAPSALSGSSALP